MAGKRGFRKARKPTLKKAKRMVTKNHKAKAKKNMDTFFLKTKVLQNVTPSQGVTTSNYIYYSQGLDPGIGTYPGVYLQNAEFQLYRLQYDKFRVNSVKITVTPKANVLDQANAANNDSLFNLTGDGLVHTCIDRDSQAPSSVAIVSRYPSYRKYSILKPFSRSYSIKYPTGVWLDCQAPLNFTMAREIGLLGSVNLYAENILEDNAELFNEPWAQIMVEHNIVFQGKSSNSLVGVYDENNTLTGVTIVGLKTTDNKSLSQVVNVRGTLSDDTRTSNEITELPITDHPAD